MKSGSLNLLEPSGPAQVYRDCFTFILFYLQDGAGFQPYDPLSMVLAMCTTCFDIKIFKLCLCRVFLYWYDFHSM